jgi:tRNA 2-selenouridine synthase
MARLLTLLGHSIATLQGGYKSYRRWALQKLEEPMPSQKRPLLVVLGGLTGSGKTAVLHALQKRGEQVIDLEMLARHRGSAFGGISMPAQPSQEHFENNLAFQLEQIDWRRPVWIEDESRLIGRCHLPKSLYQAMLQAPLFFLQCSKEERLNNLLIQYGGAARKELLLATSRIAKRLGSQLTGEIMQLFEQENRALAFERLLTYYDRTYQHHATQRSMIHKFSEKERAEPAAWAYALQHFYRQKFK